jgi:hypothetical protein
VFQTAYQSAWQHPGIAWIAGLPLVLVGLLAARRGRQVADADPRRKAFVWAFVILEAEILLDAFFTGALSPLSSAGGGGTAAAIVFVILGDLRFFYLVERQRGEAASSGSAALTALKIALPVSFVMPVVSAVLTRIDPARHAGTRLFLVYELGLVVVVAIYCAARRPLTRDRADGRARYVRRLMRFELAQYGGWALADAVILFAPPKWRDLGWAIRVVPNVLYYALFVPVATWATPSGSRV